MSTAFPETLKRACIAYSIRVPQIYAILPAGYQLDYRIEPPNGRGWIFTGFMIGGQLVGGGNIPGYDLTAGTGLRGRLQYYNDKPIMDISGGWRYFTTDYLYTHITEGIRVATKAIAGSLVNDLLVPVEVSFTQFRYEMHKQYILDLFKEVTMYE